MRRIVWVFACYVLVTTSCLADKVLILGSTVIGGVNSREALAAEGLGYTVDVVSDAVWMNMAAQQPSIFSSYRAIILGDPSCRVGTSSIAAAENTRLVWGPQVIGNIIIGGMDASYPGHAGGPTFTTNAIRFAANQPDKTGLYVSLSCYYGRTPRNTSVPLLDPFGTFTVNSVGCYNDAHIVATHPVMSDLTDASLSDWDCSVHETFASWPDSGPNKFLVLAIAENIGSYVASDFSVGTPYILARGEGLLPSTDRFKLTPTTARNPTNFQHTVCATVITNGTLASGVDVVFNVTSGPNAGTTGSAVTDGDGVACFTFTGIGGVGTDIIVAQYTNSLSQVVTSTPVSKAWFDPCGSGLSADASIICGSDKILVTFNEFVSETTATDPANYTLDHGFNVTDASFTSDSHFVVELTTDQSFVLYTTYNLQISDVQDLCGRVIDPNPTTLNIVCDAPCPYIVCPSNIVVQCMGPGGTRVDYDVWVNPDCTNTTVNCYPPSGSLFDVGTTTVICEALDASGGGSNTYTCSFTVTVTDVVPPVINCPSDIVVYAVCTNVPVSFSVTATDNCCADVSVVCTPPSGGPFAAGMTTPVHCVATDCNGNSNSCDFTVQVIQVDDAGTPQIIFCPSNIVVCATNGCGPMPDATFQVEASDGEESVYVSQSIAPGTILCSNTNVTFTVSNLCGQVTNCTAQVIVEPCCCNTLLTLRLPSALTNITVWEHTGTSTAHLFPTQPMDPRLLPIPGGPTTTNFDFSTSDGEYYDVFLSAGIDSPNTNGCCLTLVCYEPDARTNYDAGGNIDAVDLDFSDGLQLHATSVGGVQLGQGLTDPNLSFTGGAAVNALGRSDGIATVLGYGNSLITLCFLTPCPPDMDSFGILHPGYITLDWRRGTLWPDIWEVASATELSGTWVPWEGATNPPIAVPTTNATMFFRLQGVWLK